MSSSLVLRATSHHHSQTFLHPLCLSFSSFGLLYLTSKEAESLASALRLISPSHPCQHMHLPHLSLFFFTTLVSVLSMTSLPCSRDPHTEQHSSLSSFITSHLISYYLFFLLIPSFNLCLLHDLSPSSHSFLYSYSSTNSLFQPQKSIMSPFGNVFNPSKGASSSLASTLGDFHTPSQGSAMKFLNAGSTAEGSSTKRSSLSPVKPVGSGFSSPSRVSAPLVQGPVFSTDTDPNTSETRFVCFDLIPEQWTQNSADGCVLNRALEYVSSSFSVC